MSLAVTDLTIRAGSRVLVDRVSFTANPAEPLTIIGETGAGKSLIAQAAIGALSAGLSMTGAVHLAGRRLDSLAKRDREALWGRRIAMLPQEPWRALDPLMRSGAQVAESHVFVADRGWPQASTATRASFSRLGLEAAALCRLPGTLSGGMAQRVAFAAATAGQPQVLLADEPTKGLDELRRNDVIALLQGFASGGGILVTITHDIAVARALGGSVLILRAGAVVEEGLADRVLAAPTSDFGRQLVAADPANWPELDRRPPSEVVVMRAQRLTIGREGRALASHLELSLHAGDHLAITGPSGIGKSTLLDTLAGLVAPVAGVVERAGPALSPYAVQKLYQDPPAAFAPRVSLGESFRDLERRHGLPADRIPSLLGRLGLASDLLARRPNAVSGGELQRLALARVLALRPAVILADEPTSRLDLVTQQHVMTVLAEASTDASAAVALVTHSSSIAKLWAASVLDLTNHTLARSAVA